MLAPPVTSQRPRASELFGFSSGLEGDDSWGDATPNRNSNKAATWNSDPRLKSAEQMLEEDGKDGYEGLDVSIEAQVEFLHRVRQTDQSFRSLDSSISPEREGLLRRETRRWIFGSQASSSSEDSSSYSQENV